MTHLNFSRPAETYDFRGTKRVSGKLYAAKPSLIGSRGLYAEHKEFYQEFFKVYTNFITNEMLFNFFRTGKAPLYNKEEAPAMPRGAGSLNREDSDVSLFKPLRGP